MVSWRCQAARMSRGRCKMEETVLSERVDAGGKTTATAGGLLSGNQDSENSPLLSLILTSLEDDKAEDIVSIALKGKSEMADHMVIASGRSSRQVIAIAEHLVDRLKVDLNRLCRVEGKDTGDWVLIDCGDAVVHVFRPEVREFYQLEKMWASPGPPDAKSASTG